MIACAAEAIEYARRNGYTRAQCVTHMAWALSNGARSEQREEYEAKGNDCVPRDGDPVICVYDLMRWGGQALVDVMRTQPRIIIGSILYEPPLFVPPDAFPLELREREAGRR